MVVVTKKAAELLKQKLVEVYMRAGGLDNMDMDPHTAQSVKEKLAKNWSEAGLGFRMVRISSDNGEPTVIMNVDVAREGDVITQREGINLFLDSASASSIGDRELDYVDEPEGDFVLR